MNQENKLTVGALGKRAPLPDRKRVQFGDFLKVLPPYALENPAPLLNYPMDGNDTVGCCVVAGWDHFRQVVTDLLTGNGINFTQADIWKFYKTQNPGFDPNGSQSTNGPGSSHDNGMVIQLFLEYLVNTKWILGFAGVNWRNDSEYAAAVYMGLGLMTGVNLTQAQMGQQFVDGTWDHVPNSPGVGGHCIPIPGMNANTGISDCVTWAKIVHLTREFRLQQMDECWFILTQYHVDHPEFRNNFDLKGFAQAVSQITDGKVIVPVPQDPSPTPHFQFTRTLKYGSIGADVTELQKRLATEAAIDGNPCYRYKENGQLYFSTGFYKQTELAVQRYQAKNGIVSSGNPASTGFGQLGPTTRARLNGATTKTSLVDAMIQVESGGNDYAEGDKTLKDHAYGCLQIRQGVVDQVNTYLKTAYKSQQCIGNRDLSLLIFNTYWKIFTTITSDRDRAMAWNGGPGFKKLYGKAGYETYTKNLDIYWAKVQKALAGQSVGTPESELPESEKVGADYQSTL